MVRTLLAASLVYWYGHPLFDGWRPATLERPLQFFYVQVNEAASQSRLFLSGFNDARIRSYVQRYMQRVDTQLNQARGASAAPVR
jgi:hypothetical protein